MTTAVGAVLPGPSYHRASPPSRCGGLWYSAAIDIPVSVGVGEDGLSWSLIELLPEIGAERAKAGEVLMTRAIGMDEGVLDVACLAQRLSFPTQWVEITPS